MSGLAHLLEREGLSTTLVGLIPQHVAAVRPPRALLVPFELGRPMGAPNQPEAQDEVLGAALELLDAAGPGPVVEALEVTVSPAGTGDQENGWACPVSFPADAGEQTLAQRVQAEVDLLMPWYERGREARGHTAVGVSELELSAAITWLGELAAGGEPVSPDAEQPVAQIYKLAIEDLKAFYLEAGTAQPGGSATDLSAWLWQETAAGELLFELNRVLGAYEGDPALRLYASFTTVPQAVLAARQTG